MNYSEVIDFWFTEIDPGQWWKNDEGFDRLISRRFGQVHAAATRCELYEWRNTIHGRVAEIIVLDQFSRNIHRDSPLSFACDPMALCLSQEAIRAKISDDLSPDQRMFCYMPFMHSESKDIHENAVTLFADPGLESNLDFELKHKAIIDRFGRYPHRNEILSRPSSKEEIEFLKQPGSSF
jgi:uncharacterized protein (DUF924 family)